MSAALAILNLLLALPLTAFADPLGLSLGQAEERLVRHNREILAARRAAEGAVAAVTIAGQPPNPSLSYSASKISPGGGIGSGGLRDKRMDQVLAVSQLIERGDKRGLRAAGAEALGRAAAADLAEVRRQQRLALHQAFFELKAAAERAQVGDDTAALYRKSLEASERRLKAGDVAEVDVSRLRIEALRAQNDARSARADLARSRRALAYLIGEEARADDLAADEPWPSAAEPADAGASLERRADVRAAEDRVEAARQARELARSQTTRDVTVAAQVEHDLSGPSPAGGVSYGVSVSLPIFARYGFEGEIAKAESDYTAAMEARARTLAQAEGEAARVRSDLGAAAERLARSDADILPAARRVAAAAEFAYAKGAMGLIDLLDARRTLRAAELDGIAARADYAKARAAWQAATEWEMVAPP